MNKSMNVHEHVSDQQLLAEVDRLVASERESTAALISALAELDVRRLYLGQGCSSMFAYCTQVLHLAEHAAYNRIEAARAARRFPVILTLLADGRLHLSAIRLLAPNLTEANHCEVLVEASHKSKREIGEIVARLQPRPDVQSSVRKLPRPAALKLTLPEAVPCDSHTSNSLATIPENSPPKRNNVEPLAPGRYKVQFTVTRDTHDKLRRVQDLLRHRIPSGDPAAIFDRALTVLLDSLEREKLALTRTPRNTKPSAHAGRHIPASVRRAVWKRDEGRCKFEGRAGRCRETGLLEFHHLIPFARGGPTTVENLELRCAAHNRFEAEQHFGLFVREAQPTCTL